MIARIEVAALVLLTAAFAACGGNTPDAQAPEHAVAEERAEKAEGAAEQNTDRAEKAADRAEDDANASDKSATKAEKAADASKK